MVEAVVEVALLLMGAMEDQVEAPFKMEQ